MRSPRDKNSILRWLGDLLCGILIGAGAILPGVSGGVLAVVFDIYQPMMEILTYPRRAIPQYWGRIPPLIAGWCVGFVAFAKGIAQSQIIFFPGGFSAGDEPDGSAKFFATAFRNEKMKEAVTRLLEEGYTPQRLLEDLTEGLDLEITDTMPARFYCNCSKERVERAVASIGAKDIREMIDEGKDIEVKCHFCNTAYSYSVDELKNILKRSKK